ncbi:hypothetical protein TYRP_021340 [Tyrophagus putrescentiae]|nr:hypothetical protein TYRP_021340 [Tyrophagus putrescentiae]
MAPRRPLDDLSLIAVFKQLTPNDQLKASQMSPRSCALVRAANRRVRTVIITGRYDIELLKKRINKFSYASKYSSIQQLIDRGGQFPDYPTPINFSKWHILVIDSEEALSSATIDCIANIFSAVTKLSFNGLDIDSCN